MLSSVKMKYRGLYYYSRLLSGSREIQAKNMGPFHAFPGLILPCHEFLLRRGPITFLGFQALLP